MGWITIPDSGCGLVLPALAFTRQTATLEGGGRSFTETSAERLFVGA
jgi:hypothetical protein